MAFQCTHTMGGPEPSLHRESTDSLIGKYNAVHDWWIHINSGLPWQGFIQRKGHLGFPPPRISGLYYDISIDNASARFVIAEQNW